MTEIPKKMLIRKSMMASYEFCARQAYKQFVLNQDTIPNTSMLLGTRFHEWAYQFFEVGQAIDPELWVELIPDEFIPIERKMVEWFINFERKRLEDLTMMGLGNQWVPYKSELQLADPLFGITGTIDRVDWVNRDQKWLAIGEYKTGESLNKKKEEGIVREMAFYAILYNAAWGVGLITQLRLINPRLGVYKEYPVTDILLESVLKRIEKVRHSIDTDIWPIRCATNDTMYAACHLCEPEELPDYMADIVTGYKEELELMRCHPHP